MIVKAALFLAKIKGLLMKWRPEIVALVAVTAVSGIGAAILGSQLIGAQRDRISSQETRITDLTKINQGWQGWAQEQAARHEREQSAILALQDNLSALEKQATASEKQLAKLEQANAEVLSYVNRPVPDGLKRMLE